MKYERLTEKIDGIVQPIGCKGDECIELYDSCNCELMDNVLCRLCELEDKIEDGRIIELPCKIGDAVFVILGNKIYEDSVRGFHYIPSDNGLRFVLGFSSPIVEYLGDKLFFTREEAEARLKELIEK